MSRPAIEFAQVWKAYPLERKRVTVGAVLRALAGRRPRHPRWALQDVSFSVGPGQSLGIVGENGSGKTSTLRLLAGISRVTRGRIETHGRIAPLIALGCGFHRELTGRENVYLNAGILGLSRQEIRAKFDEMVAFAELEDAIDAPLKLYSSGMIARLGFSVATHVDPDILLVDEILSVGDTAFRHRSYRRMQSFRDEGCAVVFVSHDLGAVAAMCDQVLWLDRGVPRRLGNAQDVIREYLEACDRREFDGESDAERPDSGLLTIDRLSFHDRSGRERAEFDYGEPFTVRVHYRAAERIEHPLFELDVVGHSGALFGANMLLDGAGPDAVPAGAGTIEARFASLPLLPGVYRLRAEVKTDVQTAAFAGRILGAFRVRTSARCYGHAHPAADAYARTVSPVVVPYQWAYDGQARQPGRGRLGAWHTRSVGQVAPE